jgi:predicted DCC family thiol-disulfide oxidoreductase YuxK
MQRLGGVWKLLGGICRVFPRALRDWAYDFIGAIRFRIFGRRDDLCPLIPPALRGRFLP